MAKIFSKVSASKWLDEILAKTRGDGFAIEFFETLSTQKPSEVERVAAFKGNIVTGERTLPCDTALTVSPSSLPGGGRAEFTTLILEGRQGKNSEQFNEVVSNLNRIVPGKLVRDFVDDSYDVLYSTSEPLVKLDADLIAENVLHHAEVKARILPELELLDAHLGLEPRTKLGPAEKFGKRFVVDLSQNQSSFELKYLPAPAQSARDDLEDDVVEVKRSRRSNLPKTQAKGVISR